MRFLRASLLPSIVLLSALAGCRQDDEIKKDIFTYPDREEIHKRVAVLAREKYVWFILLSGPEADVKKHTPAFNEFVGSIRFDVKQEKDKESPSISWTQPKDWRKDPPGGAMRYAGFRINNKPKELEVTVTRLPIEGFTLIDNIRRWEKQVNMPPSAREDQLGAHVTISRAKIDGQPVTWVDVKGYAVHTVSRPPEPVAHGKGFMPPLDLKKKPAKGNGIPFKYAAPAGWTKKQPNQIELEIYEITGGNKKAKLSFSTVGQSIASNINRWRGQVQLPDLDEAEVERSAERIMIAGTQSYYVDLANPRAKSPDRSRILGAIIPLVDETWYIKMTGPIDLLGENKNAFETFVKSFELDAR